MTADLDRLARLAQRLIGAPSAILCVLDSEARGAAGKLDRGAQPFARDVATTGRAAVEAHRIGVPLRDSAGRPLGSLCVTGARFPYYDENDVQALADLAACAVATIELGERNALVRALIDSEQDVNEDLIEDSDPFLAVGTPFPDPHK